MRFRPEHRDSIYARLIGNLGASKGGFARKDSLTPERRSEIAAKAAKARWKPAKHEQALRLKISNNG
jgi:hypothetical protein